MVTLQVCHGWLEVIQKSSVNLLRLLPTIILRGGYHSRHATNSVKTNDNIMQNPYVLSILMVIFQVDLG